MGDRLNEINKTELTNYIEQFFVGLLEGDGTITVDFVSESRKRTRIFISLKNFAENRLILELIAQHIGGRVSIERGENYVVWYATSQTDLAKVFAILAKYPLLTTRKQCQLEFAKTWLNSTEVISKEDFHILRDNKYHNQIAMLQHINEHISLPSYFPAWFSGFCEAEGHFKLVLKANNTISSSQFIIGQNFEEHILKAILIFFNQDRTISYTLNKDNVYYYKIHLGGKQVRAQLVNHFNNYPLLGYKNTKYLDWVNKHPLGSFI